MPANAAIVLADGQTTPVNHTFVPMSQGLHPQKDATMRFEYEDKSPGTSEGFKLLEMSYAKPTSQRKSSRVSLRVVDPKVETLSVNGGTAQPVVTRNNIAEITFTFDKKATEAERKDLRAYALAALANALAVSMIDKLELPY